MRPKYRIAPARDRWELRRMLHPPAIYNTQQEAISAAQSLTRTRPRRIVWAGPDGRSAGWEGYRGEWRLVVRATRARRRAWVGSRALLREVAESWRGHRPVPPGVLRRAFLGSAAPGPLRTWRL